MRGYPGRRLFLALPPETSHRLAGALLRLPLPWERLGGAEDDSRLAVTLAGVPLRNPIGLAAGFDKRCSRLAPLGRLGFGFVVGGTITRRPRAGNPRPRIVRDPDRGGLVNAMGLPNPGAQTAARALARGDRTAPRIVSLADEDLPDAVAALELLAPHADAIELNASCPNVSWGRDRDQEAHLIDLVRAFRERTDRPVLVKLPPFASEVEREVVLALARVAWDAGASGLTCSNTRPIRDARLSVGAGGVSGGPLSAETPRIVEEVRRATRGELPIVACGGIATPAQALACLEAGASAVQVYTGLIYRGPGIVGELTGGLAAALRERDTDLPSLVGAG